MVPGGSLWVCSWMFTCLAYSVRSLGMTQQEARFTWLMHGFTCTPPKKTKHSPKNIHETITQKIHKKTFTALLSGQLSTTTGMLCSILFGGITQADIFFMPLVSHEMVLHHMRFFQGHVKPLVQKDICCLTDSLGTVWWKINKGVN